MPTDPQTLFDRGLISNKAMDRLRVAQEQYKYPPSKYPGNVNSPNSVGRAQAGQREEFDYIHEPHETQEEFEKRIGPEGLKDIEDNWNTFAPVQGGGYGWKLLRPSPPVG